MMLQLEKVRLDLGRFQLDVDLRVSALITGIFGPSGAGKTTLLEIIAGLRRPAQGVVRLAGEELTNAARRHFVAPERRGIGYVPQDLALFPHLTVEENLRFGAPAKAESNRLEHLVKVLQLRPLLHRATTALSGGEKQRLAIGRALMTSPKLLLLDEPLANLDPALTRTLLQLLKDTATQFNTPVLYVTHDSGELASICDDVIVLEAGRVKAHGPFADLFENSHHPTWVLREKTAAGGTAAT